MNQENINRFLYSLYNDSSVGSISYECRKKHGLCNDQSLVYGDSYLPSLYEIFNEVKPKSSDVFYDLGSGGGRVVLWAALSFHFAKSVGIELLDDLTSYAQKKSEHVKKELSNCEITFIQADCTAVDVSDANIVYIASTCFDNKMMKNLAVSLEKRLTHGAKVITISKALPSKKFKIINIKSYPMEWGLVAIFFHEKC